MSNMSNPESSFSISQVDEPLLTTERLAELLHRSPGGLRASLYGNSDIAETLRQAKVQLGRRVYFRRDRIESIIEELTGK